MSYEMLSAIVQAKTNNNEEPEQFDLEFSGNTTKNDFMKDLEEKI